MPILLKNHLSQLFIARRWKLDVHPRKSPSSGTFSPCSIRRCKQVYLKTSRRVTGEGTILTTPVLVLKHLYRREPLLLDVVNTYVGYGLSCYRRRRSRYRRPQFSSWSLHAIRWNGRAQTQSGDMWAPSRSFWYINSYQSTYYLYVDEWWVWTLSGLIRCPKPTADAWSWVAEFGRYL